ncbi:conserved membrane hypothetical protein [Bradyrhizobium sp. STM 3843]|uniref:hypothetical protein n=1 Tax=Bradyrhizobium sp. STM 3843 TaxID=551947 RepID=UPI00024031F5|nr:hypothetical protein [Bradyrhizobium sp. STM 3843]CCE08280.1 conserved membrane hypothetical protein [Bradyrhizobium sp. STM 3843]
MTQLAAPARAAAPQSLSPQTALDRLTMFGWRGGLAAILAGLVLSFVLFGYWVVYFRNADMDFMVIYNALVMNDGKPQAFFDHPAYLTILSLKSWFRLLHTAGLLKAWTLSAIPPASDVAAFDAAMTGAVRAGRVLALLIALACVAIFAFLTRLIVRDWRVALLATLAFALSGGVAVHSRILRSELIAAMPVIFALMILIVMSRRASALRPFALALAAALCVIGLENKVQAILLIGALPVLILPFGSEASRSVAFWDQGSGWAAAFVAMSAAAAAVWMAFPLVTVGFDRALLDAAQLRPILFNGFGHYQAAIMLLILSCMITYARIWRISAAETVASMAAVIAGAALALMLLDVDYDSRNVIAIFNPLEKMLTFADASTSDAAHAASPGATLLMLLQGLGSVLARYTFVLRSSARPTVFLTWLIVPGLIVAWRRGERLLVLQALLLLLAAIGIDTLGVRRGLKTEYFIFTDPLIILAGAILLDRITEIGSHRFALPIGYALIALHIAIGQAEPVKYATKRTGPESICEWHGYYMPLLQLPWCPPSKT